MIWQRGALALLLIVGCRATGTFTCELDEHCRRGGETGRCELSGFCAFPDDDCASMWRYDPSAGDLASVCVEASDAGVDIDVDANTWPCGVKPAPPPASVTHDSVQNGDHTTVTLTNTRLGGDTVVLTTPGASLAFATSYSIVDCICPTCIDQIEIGLVPGPRAACIYDGNPRDDDPNCEPATTGTANRNLTAPTAPGMYELRFGLAQDFTCNLHPSWWLNMPPTAATTVAYVCVQ